MKNTEHVDPIEVLARLVKHPLRLHVLFKYSERVTSPREVSVALGARLNVVSYHTQVLLGAGVIELVRTRRRRGATEHFYRASLLGVIDDAGWARLPIGLRHGLVRATVDGALREAADALPRGGMDASTTHISRSYYRLDAQGRADLATLLGDVFARAREVGARSDARGATDAVPHELVIMSFERASSP